MSLRKARTNLPKRNAWITLAILCRRFSPPGKCDRMNDMKMTKNCSLLKSDSILLSASSLICIRHKIADKIACVNQALIPVVYEGK